MILFKSSLLLSSLNMAGYNKTDFQAKVKKMINTDHM